MTDPSPSAIRRLCVFCGSSPGRDPAYAEAARALGDALAARGIGVVYGGGSVGLMGVVADAVLARGGEVVGVIPYALANRELAHGHLTRLHVVATMHERKAMMSDFADAFLALPGGLGTLDELCEIATWAQLGIHRKPIGMLDVRGYFGPFLAFLDHALAEGFVRPEHRALLVRDTDAARLLDRLAAAAASPGPVVEKWVGRGDR